MEPFYGTIVVATRTDKYGSLTVISNEDSREEAEHSVSEILGDNWKVEAHNHVIVRQHEEGE
jgi:hypothetical protein